MRGFSSDGSPVSFSVFAPPSGPAEYVYREFVRKDLANKAFCAEVLTGLLNDEVFSRRHIQYDGDYFGLRGSQLVAALRNDDTLLLRAMNNADVDTDGFFRIGTQSERLSTFRHIVTEASITVTAAQAVAAKTGFVPISENPTLCRLFAIRASDAAYVGDRASLAPWLAAAVLQAVVPDEVVQSASIENILVYREKTESAYSGFVAEIDKLVWQLESTDLQQVLDDIPRLISVEIIPKVREYHLEMTGVRDAAFAGFIKSVVKWEVPTISVAFLAGSPLGAAFAAVIAGVAAAAPVAIDYWKDSRAAKRKNGLSYLLEVSPSRIDIRP